MPAIPFPMELQASLFRGALSLAERPALHRRAKGKPSLAGLPLFPKQSPGLFGKFTLFGAHFVYCESAARNSSFGFGRRWKL